MGFRNAHFQESKWPRDNTCLRRVIMNNKAPSVSGFTKEFYVFFWSDIGQLITDYINEAWRTGSFFITQRRGVIVLIPKKGDQKVLKNKRPICLLDVVYKIAAKAIAIRLAGVIDTLIARDQTGTIRGRYIGENLRTIADIINYCNEDNLDGILMALDFRNAYNSVEYPFLYAALKQFNFGNEFIQWVRVLHTDMEITISNRGFISDWFRPSRGLQQGSPSSSLLFILVIETLAIKIRSANDICGISVKDCETKLSLYCDDVTAFVADEQSCQKILDKVVEFGVASGLELNQQKSHFMRLGKSRNSSTPVCGVNHSDTVKILCINFSAKKDCRRENIEPAINNINRVLNMWSQRDLTLKGLITVAKSLIVSQLTYVMTCSQIEQTELARVQSLIMRFIWRGRPPKVAKTTLMQGVSDGGLKAPDLGLIFRSCRAIWAKRIVCAKEAAFSQILVARLHPLRIEDLLKMYYDEGVVNSLPITEFYKDVFKFFRNACAIKQPDNDKEVRRLWLWNNRTIRVDRKPVFYAALYRHGVKQMNDILDERGHLFTYQAFRTKYPIVRINPVTYIGLCQAIPRQWMTLTRSD